MRRFSQCFDDKNIFGWIKSIQKLKNKTFLKLQDGRSAENVQVVFNNADIPNDNLKRGNCVNVFGHFVESIGKCQKMELKGIHYEILSNDTALMYKDNTDANSNDRLFSVANTDLRLEVARKDLLHLRHRLDYFAALSRIRASIKESIRSHMIQNKYLEVDPPHLTNVDCEGAGETFRVVINNDLSNVNTPKLSVSGQLHLEALALGLSQVYSLGPVFRANKSGSRHHLAEFVMLEAESVTLTNEAHLCATIEAIVRQITESVLDTQDTDMELIRHSNLVPSAENRLQFLGNFLQKKFLRISFADAKDLLQREGIIAVGFEDNFSKVEEQQLIRLLGGSGVFVTDFPASLKPYYCKTVADQSLAVDLLLPDVGEVAGGSVREDDYGRLRNRMSVVGVNALDMKWYLDLRCDGGCPHGGYGLGLDRLIQFLTGVFHIEDVVTFPRTYNSCVL